MDENTQITQKRSITEDNNNDVTSDNEPAMKKIKTGDEATGSNSDTAGVHFTRCSTPPATHPASLTCIVLIYVLTVQVIIIATMINIIVITI